MLCPKCGKTISDTASFCGYCGQSIEPSSAADQTALADQAEQQDTASALSATPNQAPQIPAAPQAAQPASMAQQQPQIPSAPTAPCATAPQPLYAPAASGAVFPMTEQGKNLRLANFILCIVSAVGLAFLVVPLAWMIPMTVHSYGIYQGKKPNTTAFGILTLIFVSLPGGICLLVADKNE